MARLFASVAAAAVVAALAACGGERPAASEAPAPQVYEVRGVLRAVPDLDGTAGQLLIHHEPIPDFAGIDGEVVGMEAMTMPFTAAAGLDLSGLAAGDKVAFRLEVDWDVMPPATITAIDKLPPETELRFGGG